MGRAIQDLTANRLGRGFLPLGILALAGLVSLGMEGMSGGRALALLLGAPAAAGAMLAYGLRVVQKAFGRPHRAWMTVASSTSLLPPIFGVYVLGWLGLRQLAIGGGLAEILVAILLTWLGVWVLRSWMKVVEVERLARVMAANMHEYGGRA